MRQADKAASWLKCKLKAKSCKELAEKFNYKCPAECNVTTPLALPHTTPLHTGLNWLFITINNNIYYEDEYRNKIKVCSEYVSSTKINDQYENYWGHSVYFKNTFNYIKIAGESKKNILTSLERIGIKIYDRNLAYQYVVDAGNRDSTNEIPVILTGTPHAGWVENNLPAPYTLPYRRHTNIAMSPFLFGPSYKNGFNCSGTAKEYLQELSRIQLDNNMILALAATLAGPLLRLTESPSFAIHLWGGTPEYRRQIIKLVSSIWGNSYFAVSFSHLSENIGEIAAAHNDNTILLNVNQSVSQTKAHNLLKSLLSGTSSDTDYGSSLRHIILSVGPNPIQVKNQEARIINFELKNIIPTNFDHTKTFTNNHGHLGPTFIQKISPTTIRDIFNSKRASFQSKLNSKQQEPAIIFTVLKTAIEIACNTKLLPIHAENAFNMIDQIFINWRTNRTETEQNAIKQVLHTMQRHHQNARFEDSTKCCPGTKYDGYRFTESNRQGILFPTQKFKTLFCATVKPKRLAELLLNEEMLVQDRNGSLSSSHWVKSLRKSVRGYFIQFPQKITDKET